MPLRAFVEGEGSWRAWNDYDAKAGNGRKRKRMRMIGIELKSVPLCTNCDLDMEGKGKVAVVEDGSETFSRFDEGLSRDRLRTWSGESEGARTVSMRRLKKLRFRASSGLETELKRFINGSSSRVRPYTFLT